MPNTRTGHLTTADYRIALELLAAELERLGTPEVDPDQQLGRIKQHLRDLRDLDPATAQAALRVLHKLAEGTEQERQ